MGISSGGITEEWGEPRHVLSRLMNTVADFAPAADGDYLVDIAFRSWHNFREPEFVGVQPDMVGRTQRRFVVWHSVPQGLATDAQAQRWLASVLPETARLCREYLPRKSRAYPAEDLAREVEALAAHLAAISQNQEYVPFFMAPPTIRSRHEPPLVGVIALGLAGLLLPAASFEGHFAAAATTAPDGSASDRGWKERRP